MIKKKIEIKYFNDTDDPMWQEEVKKLMPWLYGKGIDIGAGARSINKEIKRVDIDENVNPDIIASGDKLPVKDGEYDYLVGIHVFEHFPDPRKLLTEWLRVIKTGGIIGIVHPDLTYTKKQKPLETNEVLQKNKFYKHLHEHTQESFLNLLKRFDDLPFRVIDYGPACGGWSFYVILKKTE